MRIRMRAVREHLVVEVEGDLVASEVEKFMHLAGKAASSGAGGVMLDMRGVRFMDSMGLRACIELQKDLRREGRRLVCCCMTDAVRRTFRITGADKRIKVAQGEVEGLALLDRTDQVLDRASFTIIPHFEEVNSVREHLAGFCAGVYKGREMDDALGDLTLATTEAMNNAVEHARAPRVDIEVLALRDGIVFTMTTEGEMFDPTKDVVMPSLDDDDDLPEGGFGRAIILELMDEVMYEYRDGKNILTLTYKFNPEGEEG
jgi:anti-anti-sigma factor